MTARSTVGLLDTSVWIATETSRGLDVAALPEESLLSVVTVAELHAGVLAAADDVTRARRLRTVSAIADIEVLDITRSIGVIWAELRAAIRSAGRRASVNDMWIAATALEHDMPVVTQDEDFDAIASVSGLDVLRV